MNNIDPKVIFLIIQEEKAKKLKESMEYGIPAVLHEVFEEELVEETDTSKTRGVIVFDI